jgi:hypothetical protein
MKHYYNHDNAGGAQCVRREKLGFSVDRLPEKFIIEK